MRPRRHALTLGIPVSATLVYLTAYVVGHTVPALGGGLYLQIAETIRTSGFAFPERIPLYTTDGLPYGYPPLAFYLLAVGMEAGIDGVALLRFATPVVFLGTVLVVYWYGLVLFSSRRVASVAAVVHGLHVGLNAGLVAASGFVRSLGLLFALLGTLGAYRWFAGREASPKWLLLALVGWGLTVLTHPVYATYGALGIFFAWLIWDRSVRGLASGVAVAGGGLLLASAWWAPTIANHGIGLIANGLSSHGSINHTPAGFVGAAVSFWRPPGTVLDWPRVFALLGAGVLVADGDWRRPAWLVVPTLFLFPPHDRVYLPAMGLLAGVGCVAVGGLLVERLRDREAFRRGAFGDRVALDAVDADRVVVLAFLLLILTPSVGLTAIEAGRSGPNAALPSYVGAGDREAAGWVSAETDPSARFVVVGGASEWFPYLTDRRSVVVRYGAEWEEPGVFARHESTQLALAGCWNASCVGRTLESGGFGAYDYVYVPRGEFVSRRSPASASPALHESLEASPRYDRVYRNDDVAIYERVEGESG